MLEISYYIATSLVCSILGFGATNSFNSALPASQSAQKHGSCNDNKASKNGKTIMNETMAESTFHDVLDFAMQACNAILQRKLNANILPFFHVIMVFLSFTAHYPKAFSMIEDKIPWKPIIDRLNEAISELESASKIEMGCCLRPPSDRPLPEDYALHGLRVCICYFAEDWFSNKNMEYEKQMCEQLSLADRRRKRLVSLGQQVARLCECIVWNGTKAEFTTPDTKVAV